MISLSLSIYIYVSEVGGSETHREIVSCRVVRAVRACARPGCKVGMRHKHHAVPFPFSLLAVSSFPFSLVG